MPDLEILERKKSFQIVIEDLFFYTCCGILMCAIPCPVIQLAGGYIVTKNIDVIWNETERYMEKKDRTGNR
jgi:hypothetical protein